MQRFLLVGRTGVGKSSLINAAFGVQLAETSAYEACTKLPEYHAHGTSFGDICLIDTPGLAESDISMDENYLSLVKQKINLKNIDFILYVSRLDETRFRPDEKRTLRLLTEEFGPSTWQRAWLILTFAGNVLPYQLDITSDKRIQQISAFIQKTLREYHYKFIGFQRILLIDNIKENWAVDALPIASFLA